MRTPLQVLPASCGGCGKCCETQCYPPFHEYERAYVPAELLVEIDAGITADIVAGSTMDDKPCLWFDATTRQCKHYEDRPDVCQDMVLGSDCCLEWRGELHQLSGRDSFVMR